MNKRVTTEVRSCEELAESNDTSKNGSLQDWANYDVTPQRHQNHEDYKRRPTLYNEQGNIIRASRSLSPP